MAVSRRFFRHGELPLVLLALIDQRPRHGYEIMAELSRLFGPRYRASPGSVYPAIDALEAEGLVEGSANGDRTVYDLTDTGRRALNDRAEPLAALELRLGVSLAHEDSLEVLLNRFKARIAPLNGRVDPDAATAVLERAAVEIERLAPVRIPNRRRQNER